MDLGVVDFNYYLKIGFAVLLFILVMVALIKTLDGSKKHLRTKTPALFLIYLLFIFGAFLQIILTIIERHIVKETDKGKTT
jgi:uncharacterized membrane protein